MLKKILLWGMYFVFVALLVVGGMYRTQVKSGTDSPMLVGNANAPLTNRDGNSVSHEEAGDEDTPKTMIVLTGQAETVRQGRVTVMTDANQPLELAGRSWRYAQSLGFTVQAGDRLTLEGFDENGDFKIANLTNLSNGRHVQLRDASGHPLWNEE